MATPSPRKALRDLVEWFTGGNKHGNPYSHAPVTAAIIALTRGKSQYDKPSKRPAAKIDQALYDLVELATTSDRHGNPYMKPAVKAAIVTLGGSGYDLPKKSAAKKSAHATKQDPREGKQRLFIGTYPTGIVYADRNREKAGDYLKLAFLPFATLALEWQKGVTVPSDLRAAITADAKKLTARRGENYPIDTAGHTIVLGQR